MSDFDNCWQHIGRLREIYLLRVKLPPPIVAA